MSDGCGGTQWTAQVAKTSDCCLWLRGVKPMHQLDVNQLLNQ